MDRAISSVLALFALVFASPAFGLEVILELDGYAPRVSVYSYDGSGAPWSYAYLDVESLPFTTTHAVSDGGSAAQSSYDFSHGGFEIVFSHAREATETATSDSDGSIHFWLDQDAEYLAEGAYSAVDADGRWIRFTVYIYDLDGLSLPFSSQQISESTPNESFVLGGTGGDHDNVSLGSLTGRLTAGHHYILLYNAELISSPTGGSSAASASGYFRLSLIPLPQCGDGIDNDGDGLIDHPDDPGCFSSRSDNEAALCQDGRDNDGDALIDFDGGLSALGYVAAPPDPQCAEPWQMREAACGLGAELALLLPPLVWLLGRRRQGSLA